MSMEAILGALERRVAALVDATTPSDVFRLVLEGSRVAVPRAAIFLHREGLWRGWGCTGYPAGAAGKLRAAAMPFDAADLVPVPDGPEPAWRPLLPTERMPDLGQPHAENAALLPLRVGGKPVAVLVAEGTAGETPWEPDGLAVLVHAARLRLELDLALRRVRGAAAESSRRDTMEIPAPAPSEPPETGTPGLRREVPAAAAKPVTELEPAPEPVSSSEVPPAISDPRLEDARRFARLIATDIRLYNEEAVVLGRRHKDLVRRLGDQLERGRESFHKRFEDLGEPGIRILRDSYVQVLAGGDESLIPTS